MSIKTVQALREIEKGSYTGVADVQDHILYDTIPFGPSTKADYAFFSTIDGKSKADTNMLNNSQLPNGQAMEISGIKFDLLTFAEEATVEDVNGIINAFYTVMQNSTVQIEIPGREYDLQVPGSAFLPSVVATQSAEEGSVTSTPSMRVGDFNTHSWMGLKTAIVIGNLVSFKLRLLVDQAKPQVAAALTLLNDSGNTPASLRWSLRGTLKRLK
jgi:hypothetical protein